MQVAGDRFCTIRSPHGTDPQLGEVHAAFGEVVTLENHHVARVAALAFEPAAGGGVLLHGANHLQMVVADHQQAVFQAKAPTPGSI